MSQQSQDPKFCTKTSLIQLGYGVWVNFISLAIGLAYGFPSIQIPQLVAPTSHISVTVEQASWIASIMSLFCPIGCVFSGIMMDKFGRKIMIMWCNLPMFFGWIYTAVSPSASHIIIARSLLGLGCGMAMGPARLYTSEISRPNMRGLLGATPNIFLALGITLQAAFGLFFQWNILCYICGAFTLLLFFSYYLLTETPYYLLLQDSPELAMKALASFRARDYDIDAEIDQLIEFKQHNHIRSLNYSEKMTALLSRSACQPFGIIMAFIAFGCFTGCPIVTLWTIELLLATNSSVDAYEGNFYIAFTRLTFAGVASALLFRVPIKRMALVTVSCVGFIWLFLGIFLHLETEPSVVPQISITLFAAFASLSFYILPFLLMSELYPLQIRGTITGISISIANVEMFVTAKCFPVLKNGLGMPNVILLFSTSAFLCLIFLSLFLPETKGLTLQEIEEYFKNSRSTPASERQLSSLHQFSNGSKKVSHLSEIVETKAKTRNKVLDGNESLAPPSIISRQSKKSATLLTGQQFRKMDDDEVNKKSNKDEKKQKDDPSTSKDSQRR